MTESDSTPRFTVRVGGEDWEEVAGLSEAAADDNVFAVDDAGRLMFGDGKHGRYPPDGAIVTITYREGTGAEGNSEVTITTRWPPAGRRYVIALSSSSVRVGAIQAGVDRFAGGKRFRYFAGQLLGASDFQAEQEYLIGRRYLHNRVLHGFGVASGLSVTVAAGGASPSVVVAEGLALDRFGREVELDVPVALPIGNPVCPQYVIIEYVEREVDPAPSSEDCAGTVASRIEEGASIRLSHEAVTDHGIVLARLLPDSTGWKVDGAFDTARCNRAPP